MFALHWICALTLALFSCLGAQPVKKDVFYQISTLNSQAEQLISSAKCPDDMLLYSPSDIKKECLSSALNCTLAELDVLQAECNDLEEVVDNITTMLEHELNIPASTSTACSCESNEVTNVKQFLNNMEGLVQQLHAVTTDRPVIM